MKLEGEYAVDKKQRWHRILSAVVFCLLLAFRAWLHGPHTVIYFAAIYGLPLALIWFPDAMSRYNGMVLGRGRHIDQPSHPVFLRWAGWFLFLALLCKLIFLWLS